MNKTELRNFQLRLEELHNRLAREVNMLEDELREDVMAPGELSSVPTHPADQDVEGLDEHLALAQNEQHLLDAVIEALDRINHGSYGTCQDCQAEIEKERLDALPYTPRCSRCARERERDGESPSRAN